MNRTSCFRQGTVSLAALLLAALSPSAALAQAKSPKDITFPPLKSFSIQQPQKHVLPNGLTIFLMEDHELPLIDLTALVRTGGRQMPAGKTGMGQIFGDAWRTGGTKTQTGDQLDDYLETRAAKVETFMEVSSAGMSLNCLKEDFPETLKIFSDVMTEPAFADAKIEIAKNNVKTQIARRNDSPGEIIGRESTKLGYGPDSPYARVPEYATVASVTRQDLLDWHKKYILPNRTLIGVVGDFDSKQMLATLTKTFGSWPKGAEFSDPEAPYQKSPKPGTYFIEKKDVTKSSVQMVHLGTLRSNPDSYALDVLNEILGGSFKSRLFSNVRSLKGLAYSVYGGVGIGYDYPGLFRVSVDTKNSTAAAAIDALYEELDGLLGKKPATEEELKRAKDSILNSFIFRIDSKDKILSKQLTYAYYNYPADTLQRYRSGIEKVTLQDVSRVAKSYIHRDQLAVLVVGKSSEFDRPLSSFGRVAALDITIPQPEEPKRAPATAESRQKGKALFAKVIDSLGGKDKVGSVKELELKGMMSAKTPMGDMSMKILTLVALPDRVHYEAETPMGKMVMVCSADGGFVSAGGQTQDLPDSAREEVVSDLRRMPLFIAQRMDDPKVTISYAGPDKVGDLPVEMLDVTNDGTSVRFFIDPQTWRVVRASYRATGPQGPVEAISDYSEYRQVEGVWLAHAEKVTHNGQDAQSLHIDEWRINPGIDPKLFERPAAGS